MAPVIHLSHVRIQLHQRLPLHQFPARMFLVQHWRGREFSYLLAKNSSIEGPERHTLSRNQDFWLKTAHQPSSRLTIRAGFDPGMRLNFC